MGIGTPSKYNVKNGYIRNVTSSDKDGFPMSRHMMAGAKQTSAKLAEFAKQTKNDPRAKEFNEQNAESAKNAEAAVDRAREFRKHAKIVDKINPEGKAVTPTEDYTNVDKIDDYKKGGKVKTKPMKAFAKGGSVRSAASRGDGCATKGHTKGAMR